MSYYYEVPRYCGIYYIPSVNYEHGVPSPSWLPQVSLSTNSRLHDTASSTVLTQTFINPSKTNAIRKAKYTFPLYESCAVVAFRCFVGKRLIEGVVKEKEGAKAKYKEAVARGETAGLLEQQTPDVFSTSLGNIPAGETVKVEIEYIMELKHDAEVDGLRFTIPTSIAPRYGQAPVGVNTYGDQAALETGMKISVQLTMPSNIRSVQSPSHSISMHLGGHVEDISDDDFDPKHAVATLSQTSVELGADFVLLVKCADLSSPRALLETHPTLPNSKALMVTLVPKFALPSGPKPEIVFIVDRSGSMVDKMAALKSALSVFLKSLPVGVKFNICSFGSDYSFLWAKSQPYSADTLDAAQRHVDSMASDLGGTEIFPPIQATVLQRYKDLPLEMMVLTDGEVWNTGELFQYIEKETAMGDVRLFSLGVGEDVSHALVEGLARVGRGLAQMVSNEQEGIEGKVVRMLRAGLSAHINDYRLEWDDRPPEPSKRKSTRVTNKGKQRISLFDSKANADTPIAPTVRYADLPDFSVPAVVQAPYKLPPLFPFSRSTAYVILSGDVRAPSSVWLRGTAPSGDQLELEIAVQVVPEQGHTIHQLAARKILQGLEEGNGYIYSGKYGVDPEKDAGIFDEWVGREGTRVGITYGLASKWTSFVAVEKKKKKERTATKGEKFVDAEKMEIDSSTNGEEEYELIDDRSESFPEDFHRHRDPYTITKHKSISHMLSQTDCRSTDYRSTGGPSSPLTGGGGQSIAGGSIRGRRGLIRGRDLFSPGAPSPIPATSSDPLFAAKPTLPGSAFTESVSVERRAIASTPRARARALIKMQTFDGSFSLTGALAAVLGVRLADLKAKLMEFVPVSGAGLKEEEKKRLWATVLAVRVFEGSLKGEKEMWELVVEKANGWIMGLGAVQDGDVSRLEVLASEILGQ